MFYVELLCAAALCGFSQLDRRRERVRGSGALARAKCHENGAFTASLLTTTPCRAQARIRLRECSPRGYVCECAKWHTLSLHLV